MEKNGSGLVGGCRGVIFIKKKLLLLFKMNILILIIIFIVAYQCYSLFIKKDGFGIKRRVKKLAKLIPITKKTLVPVKKQTKNLVESVTKQPKNLVGSVTKQPQSILKKFKEQPSPSKPKKSVWWHPAVVTGAIVGTGLGIGGGEIYNRAKDGRLTKYYVITNPFTGKKGYYRFGRSQSIKEDDRLFVKYDGPPECKKEGGETRCYFVVKRKDFE